MLFAMLSPIYHPVPARYEKLTINHCCGTLSGLQKWANIAQKLDLDVQNTINNSSSKQQVGTGQNISYNCIQI